MDQCRICLVTDMEEYIEMECSKFEMDEEVSYLDFFLKLMQLDAVDPDNLPKTMCNDCANDLQVAYKLVTTARQTDAFLRNNKVNEVTAAESDIIEEYLECETLEFGATEEDSQIDGEDYEACTEHLAEDDKFSETSEYYPEDELDDEYLLEYKKEKERCNISAVTGSKWKCLACKLVLRGDVSFEGHMNMHKNVRPYRCDQCRCNFRCKDSLERHLSKRHQEISSETAFSNVPEEFQDHKFTEEALLESCSQCSKSFDSSMALEEHHKMAHSNAHLDKRPQECHICMKHYSTATSLRNHINSAHPRVQSNSDTVAECDVCKKQLLHRNLERHMALHEKRKCDKLESKEEVSNRYMCTYCARECKNEKALQQHEKIHLGESPGVVYVCADCDRQYNTEQLLMQHRKQTHKERDNICQICGNAFKLKNQLMNHMKLHLAKNIQCSQCDRKYARIFDLNVHMRTHTGEMPYACHLCDKKFALKVRLTYHLQKHNGVKHACKECGALFNSRQKLKVHSYKHTGMPYRCEACNDHGFAGRDVFKRHILRVHNATITDEALVEMFQRNTGKTTRILPVNELDDNTNVITHNWKET